LGLLKLILIGTSSSYELLYTYFLQGDAHGDGSSTSYGTAEKSDSSFHNEGYKAAEIQKSASSARATDSTRVAKFIKELSSSTVELGTLLLVIWQHIIKNFHGQFCHFTCSAFLFFQTR
jgi:hypothetical protein